MNKSILRPRDLAFVEFVRRYRLATNHVVATQLLPGRSMNAVAKVTARLCSAQILNRYVLVPPENYFRLGGKAISTLGVSSRLGESLGPQALPTDFATLIYATSGNTRRRLTGEEVNQYMPWLPGDLSHSPYCVDKNGQLELIRVDLGGSPQHVARKTTQASLDRLDVPQISELAAATRFQVVVLTTSEEKAKAISKALVACGCTDAVRVHIAVIPRLSFLLLRAN
ncbi:hypothetical protein CEE69_00935 [Rhodopirellula bahusiensis]|uniref:Uncharacterized protein n=2 Tax=Rhodopirellula bahusiensis TaxID=2014065 RepID=A0A2G1WD61_9BACT|nr:hypothetical protein CEE69_00935 [Rhodopirellula bahusiensis]